MHTHKCLAINSFNPVLYGQFTDDSSKNNKGESICLNDRVSVFLELVEAHQLLGQQVSVHCR